MSKQWERMNTPTPIDLNETLGAELDRAAMLAIDADINASYSNPWFWTDNVPDAHIGARAILDSHGFTVCNPSPMGQDKAYLIAAAPALLAALEALLEQADLGEVCEETQAVVDQARAAIAAARGQA